MEVLVIGDLIIDRYIFGTSDRICPESPVPVIVPTEEKETNGGAGLVKDQLRALGIETAFSFGSISEKKRIFVGNHLICRLDKDSFHKTDHHGYERIVVRTMKQEKPKLLIISDYGKGSFTESSAKRIVQAANILDIPVFVDAKHNWTWYENVHAKFPNQREIGSLGTAKYIIYKRGQEGCIVAPYKKAKIPVPLEKTYETRDTTGAGDCYLAAFAAHWVDKTKDMVECAKFANRVAAVSVTHTGTHVVLPEEIS